MGHAINLQLFCLLSILGSCSPELSDLEKNAGHITGISHLRFEQDNALELMIYEGFVVKFDSAHRVPAYSLHHISPNQLSDSLGIKSKRSNRFWVDSSLIEGLSATSDDYRKSGFDRGHHVPAGDFVYSQVLKDESFVYTNISPQNTRLNRGILAKLEKQIREKVVNCNCAAYVVTGTHFRESDDLVIGPNKVGVPGIIYKIAFFPQKVQMYGFVLDNTAFEYNADPGIYQQTIDSIEALTLEDFFEQLPDDLEEKLERTISKF